MKKAMVDMNRLCYILLDKVTHLTPEGIKIVCRFCLYALEHEEDPSNNLWLIFTQPEDPLEYILDEGTYEYYSKNPYKEDLVKVMEDLCLTSPVSFSKEDIKIY